MPLQQSSTAAAHGRNYASDMVIMCSQAAPFLVDNTLRVSSLLSVPFLCELHCTYQGPTLVLSISFILCSSNLVGESAQSEGLTLDIQIKCPDLLLWYDGPASCCDEKVFMAWLMQVLSLCRLHL